MMRNVELWRERRDELAAQVACGKMRGDGQPGNVPLVWLQAELNTAQRRLADAMIEAGQLPSLRRLRARGWRW